MKDQTLRCTECDQPTNCSTEDCLRNASGQPVCTDCFDANALLTSPETSPEAVGATPKERAEKLVSNAVNNISVFDGSCDCKTCKTAIIEAIAVILRETNLVQLLERIEGLERDLKEAKTPICIGQPIIEILAKDGQWLSDNGNGVVAADSLFRKNPYKKLEELEKQNAALNAVAKAADAFEQQNSCYCAYCDDSRKALTALREKGWKPE